MTRMSQRTVESSTRSSQSREADERWILGLDIGVASVGWALVAETQQGYQRIVDLGVRIFEAGVEGTPEAIASGRDASRATARHDARQMRRQTRRRTQRIGRVFRLLQSLGLLPAASGDLGERKIAIDALDASLSIGRSETAQESASKLQYLLRRDGLDSALTAFALGRVLLHLAQRRGYKSNRRAERSASESGVVAKGIEGVNAEIAAAGMRTLGEYFASLDPHVARIRGRYTARAQYEHEFDALMSEQRKHHPLLDDTVVRRLRHAIFFQRPLRSSRHLVARCELEPKRRRCPIADPLAQEFRYLQRVNDLRALTADGDIRPLHPPERACLIEALQSSEQLTFAAIRRLLKKSLRVVVERFNLEEGGETRLPGHRTFARITSAAPELWSRLDVTGQHSLILLLRTEESPERLRNRLLSAPWSASVEESEALARMSLEEGYVAFSRRALQRIVPRLRLGEALMTAKLAEYPAKPPSEPKALVPSFHDEIKSIRNPAVERSLSELRKVVNALIRKHGKPDAFRIELARDLKKSRKAREEISKLQRGRESERQRLAQELSALDILAGAPSSRDIEKLRLLKECGGECPYTGKAISPIDLFGSAPTFDVEHIVPFNRSLDDSFGNKTLCHVHENRHVKRNRTPCEAYAGDADRWKVILKRVSGFSGDMARRKLELFQLDAIADDFAARHLNDTRIASLAARDLLGTLYGGASDVIGTERITASTGGITALVRRSLGLDGLLNANGVKSRDDHRHHAVDALVVALTDRNIIARVQARARQQPHLILREMRMDDPWEGFLPEVRAKVEGVVVSHRVSRSLGGPLHKEQLYAVRHAGATSVPSVRIRRSLSALKRSEVALIVDPVVRQIVSAAVGDGDPAKMFVRDEQLPCMPCKDGRRIPIRSVRIAVSTKVVGIGAAGSRRHVSLSENHHLIVYRSAAGVATADLKWQCVSRLEVHRRVAAREVVVRAPEGSVLVMSLVIGDTVERTVDQKTELLKVRSLSDGDIELVRLTDASRSTSEGRTRIRIKSLKALRKYNLTKVSIDPLGGRSRAGG